MVISNVIRRLRHYCRCICIWQCCTTFQDFEPDFNDVGSTPKDPGTPTESVSQSTSYFHFGKPQPPKKMSQDVQSQTTNSTTKSKNSSVAVSVAKKIDELECLLKSVG